MPCLHADFVVFTSLEMSEIITHQGADNSAVGTALQGSRQLKNP